MHVMHGLSFHYIVADLSLWFVDINATDMEHKGFGDRGVESLQKKSDMREWNLSESFTITGLSKDFFKKNNLTFPGVPGVDFPKDMLFVTLPPIIMEVKNGYLH